MGSLVCLRLSMAFQCIAPDKCSTILNRCVLLPDAEVQVIKKKAEELARQRCQLDKDVVDLALRFIKYEHPTCT